MRFYSGRFKWDRPGAVFALALSHLCGSLFYCIGEADGSGCVHKLLALVQIHASVCVQLREFLPDVKSDINYFSQDTVILRIHRIPP